MIYSCAAAESNEWILDTGATDHMTPLTNASTNLISQAIKPHIKLPNGTVAEIELVGNIVMANGFQLIDVLVVPDFHFNLLSISKLTRDMNCVALFHPEFCLIQDCATMEIKGLGKQRGGLHYLLEMSPETLSSKQFDLSMTKLLQFVNTYAPCNNGVVASVFTEPNVSHLWYSRLGHAPFAKMKHIPCIGKDILKNKSDVCLTCPVAKFTK